MSSEIERALRRGREQSLQAAARAAERLSERVGGDGLADVSYARLESPLGPLLAASTRRGIVRVAFAEEGVDAVLEQIAHRLSPRIVEARAPLDGLRVELEQYFKGERRSFELTLDRSLMGRFTRRVLGATARIPYGSYSSYAQVAAQAGSPGGSRAAGNALGANPIPILIPCHRVLRSGGTLGGYAGGPARKRRLLELEGAIATGR